MFSHAQQKYGNTVVTERTATVALCVFAVLQLTPLTQTEHFLLLQPHIKTMEGEHLLLSAICFFWEFFDSRSVLNEDDEELQGTRCTPHCVLLFAGISLFCFTQNSETCSIKPHLQALH